MTITPQQAGILTERLASEQDIAGAVKMFEGACWRGNTASLTQATEAAHAALQSHLDAISSSVTATKRSAGL